MNREKLALALEALHVASSNFRHLSDEVKMTAGAFAEKTVNEAIAALTDEQPQKVEDREILGWPVDKPLAMFETVAEALRAEGQTSRADCITYLIERCRLAEQTAYFDPHNGIEEAKAILSRLSSDDLAKLQSISFAPRFENIAEQTHEPNRAVVSRESIDAAFNQGWSKTIGNYGEKNENEQEAFAAVVS